jgi:hypothetical protein
MRKAKRGKLEALKMELFSFSLVDFFRYSQHSMIFYMFLSAISASYVISSSFTETSSLAKGFFTA